MPSAGLLATFAHLDTLEIQVRVTHRDKPDFALRSEDRMIGIEVTEGVSTDYARCCVLAEREFPGVGLPPHAKRRVELTSATL